MVTALKKSCPPCSAAHICNPVSGRCVLRSGPTGRALLAAPTVDLERLILEDAAKLTNYNTIFADTERIPAQYTELREMLAKTRLMVYVWPGLTGQRAAERIVAAFDVARRWPDDLAAPPPVTVPQVQRAVHALAERTLGATQWRRAMELARRTYTRYDSVRNLKPGPVARRSSAQQLRRAMRATSAESTKTSLPCDQLVTVPQSHSRGTCWFNAALMIYLFSDRMRVVTKHRVRRGGIQAAQRSPELNDVLQRLATLLLLYKQKSTEATNKAHDRAFQYGSRPEDILKALYIYSSSIGHPWLTPKRATGLDGGNWMHAVIFGQLLGVRFGICAMTSDARLYRIDHHLAKPGQYFKDQLEKRVGVRFLDQSEHERHPDVICIVGIDENFKSSIIEQQAQNKSMYDETLRPSFVRDTQTLVLGQRTYRMDAVYMARRVGQSSHAIAGVTCNGRRYFYNGWLKQPGRPCRLIPEDWLTTPIYIGSQQNSCYTKTPMDANSKQYGFDIFSMKANEDVVYYVADELAK